MDVARHVWRHEGGLRGLYKGLGPTLAREVPGSACMFGMYELVRIQLAHAQVRSHCLKLECTVAVSCSSEWVWCTQWEDSWHGCVSIQQVLICTIHCTKSPGPMAC